MALRYELVDLRLLKMLENRVDFDQYLLARATPEKTHFVDLVLKYKWIIYVAVFLIMLGINHVIRSFQGKKPATEEDDEFETLDERLKREKKEK